MLITLLFLCSSKMCCNSLNTQLYGKCSRHIIMQPLIIMKCYTQDFFYGKKNKTQCYIIILILLLFVVHSLSHVQLLILYVEHINIQLDKGPKYAYSNMIIGDFIYFIFSIDNIFSLHHHLLIIR